MDEWMNSIASNGIYRCMYRRMNKSIGGGNEEDGCLGRGEKVLPRVAEAEDAGFDNVPCQTTRRPPKKGRSDKKSPGNFLQV